jgi:hypothetical protein
MISHGECCNIWDHPQTKKETEKLLFKQCIPSMKPAFISHQSSVGENKLHWRQQMERSHTATPSIVWPFTLAAVFQTDFI